MYETVLPETLTSLQAREQEMRTPVIVLLFFEVIVEVTIWVSIARIREHITAVLRMMLAIPAQTLLAAPKIMKVLSGDFSVHRSESLKRDTEFFESAFMELPVPALYANGELIIQAANNACIELFCGKEIVNRNLHGFFRDSDIFGMDSVKFDQGKEFCVLGGFRPTGQPEVRLEFYIAVEHNLIAVIMHNSEALNEYDNQIRLEKEIMEQLLARVLPAPLLRRIQQEGRDRVTGFAVVQVSSIIFLNFVHFAPWAVSVGATVALSCLNELIAKFDGILQGKPAMTKIKTMGDVYISAGGIFSEVNQQHEHATEALNFGLEAVREVHRFNRARGTNFSLRAGEHIGGPLLAGIIPTACPTFEILGAAVGEAMKLEQMGVPMAVAVSRAVYVLLDRTAFTITERSALDAKGTARADGIMYIVTP
jgi:class 3 adenylate cyclase